MKFIMLLPLLLAQMETPPDVPADTLPPPIRPATSVQASDVRNDEGNQLEITWELSPDDALLDRYIVSRATEEGDFQDVETLAPGATSYIDNNDEVDRGIEGSVAQLSELNRELRRAERQGEHALGDTLRADIDILAAQLESLRGARLKNGVPYRYRVTAVRGDEQVPSVASEYAKASGQLFHTGRINVLVVMLVFFALVTLFISQAKRGKELFLRKIAGLEAIDDAVGRATEMGRPILFVPGISGISDIATIAALNILQGIAKKAAQYDTPIIVPNRDPIVYTVAREIVKEAYSDVGRPDAFNPDSVFFITTSQFAYVTAVNGIMLREKPATNFFLGMFYAESLLLAETGNIAGSIQIAGTDASAQLPFFITACDYTIIGEELYAASAYLSREPNLLGTIKAQDWGKVVIGGALVVLSILALFGDRLTEFATRLLTTI